MKPLYSISRNPNSRIRVTVLCNSYTQNKKPHTLFCVINKLLISVCFLFLSISVLRHEETLHVRWLLYICTSSNNKCITPKINKIHCTWNDHGNSVRPHHSLPPILPNNQFPLNKLRSQNQTRRALIILILMWHLFRGYPSLSHRPYVLHICTTHHWQYLWKIQNMTNRYTDPSNRRVNWTEHIRRYDCHRHAELFGSRWTGFFFFSVWTERSARLHTRILVGAKVNHRWTSSHGLTQSFIICVLMPSPD